MGIFKVVHFVSAERAVGALLIENEQFQEAIGWLKRSVAHGFEPARELLKTIESIVISAFK